MSRQPEDYKLVCTSCGFANYPTASYCVECETALKKHVVDDPYNTLKTTRRAGRTTEKPRSPIVVVGIWVLFLPVALYCLSSLIEMVPLSLQKMNGPGERLLFLVIFAVMAAGLYLSSTILRSATVGLLQERNRKRIGREDAAADDSETGGEFDDEDEDEND